MSLRDYSCARFPPCPQPVVVVYQGHDHPAIYGSCADHKPWENPRTGSRSRWISSRSSTENREMTTSYVPMDDADDKGGADFSLVTIGDLGKPSCVHHRAMNKVSPSPPGLWRCITTAGPKINGCRAGCEEIRK